MKPINECKTVAELLEDPARWTQGVYARDEHGTECGLKDPAAACFCMRGGIRLIYGDNINAVFKAFNTLSAVTGEINSSGVLAFNDAPNRTHAEVLAAVRKAGI